MSSNKSAFKAASLAALLVASSIVAPAPAFAESPPSPLDSVAKEIRAIFDRTKSAVVRIQADDEHGRLSGTGFFIDPNGTLVTTYSVGGEAEEIEVTFDGNTLPARRVIADRRSGIAVLKVDAATPFLAQGKSTELTITSPVLTIGFALALPAAPSFGLVAGFDIGHEGRWFAARHIRANVPVQRGEAGAPLLNARGEVVGVLVSTLDGNSGIFALPIEAAEKIHRDYQRSGRVRPGWLGVDVRQTDATEHGSSARIRSLQATAPAYRAGLRAGDVITKIGTWEIASPDDVLNAAFYLSAEEPLCLKISRAGHEHEFQVTPLDPPDENGPSVQPEPPTVLGATQSKFPLLRLGQ
jgi:serine protease Do